MWPKQKNSDIYLIQTFRYPLQAWCWEIPGGGIDEGHTPLQAAQQELQEELGFTADTWIPLGDLYPSNNGTMHDHGFVFLARNLHEGAARPETGEAIRQRRAYGWDDICAMVRRGDLTDCQTLGALLHYRLLRESVSQDTEVRA